IAVGELQRVAEKVSDVMTCKQLLERETREQRSQGQKPERDQDDRRAFVRSLIVAVVMRLAVKRLEDEPPGIERRQRRREQRQPERDQDDRRAFVRSLIVAVVMRLAVKRLEDEPPGIERRQRRREQRQPE